ncbi:MAG: hypothetical protein ABJF01_22075 [bacterium]
MSERRPVRHRRARRLLTAKCIRVGLTAIVTATVLADTTQTGTATLNEVRRSSC